jgi:hypothetical protein
MEPLTGLPWNGLDAEQVAMKRIIKMNGRIE